MQSIIRSHKKNNILIKFQTEDIRLGKPTCWWVKKNIKMNNVHILGGKLCKVLWKDCLMLYI